MLSTGTPATSSPVENMMFATFLKFLCFLFPQMEHCWWSRNRHFRYQLIKCLPGRREKGRMHRVQEEIARNVVPAAMLSLLSARGTPCMLGRLLHVPCTSYMVRYGRESRFFCLVQVVA